MSLPGGGSGRGRGSSSAQAGWDAAAVGVGEGLVVSELGGWARLAEPVPQGAPYGAQVSQDAPGDVQPVAGRDLDWKGRW